MNIFEDFFGGSLPTALNQTAFLVHDEGILVKLDDLDAHPCRIVIPIQYPVEDTFVVYSLYDLIKEEIFYIGKTKNFMERMKQHCRVTRFNPQVIRPFGDYRLNDRKIELYDADQVVVASIFAICPSEHLMNVVEAALIHYYRHTILNVQRKHNILKGWEYDLD